MSEPETNEPGNTIVIGSVRVPYLREYLGWWMLEATAFNAAVERANKMDIAAHVQAQQAVPSRAKNLEERSQVVALAMTPMAEATRQSVPRGYSYDVVDGVGIVSMAGTLMKHVSSFDDGTSTVALRNTVRYMTRDPNVRAGILIIDSPGGTVSGAYDLADDIAALNAKKPTYAYIEDLGASAAYLQASQTRGISANRNALVGSIGTYGVVYDYSKMFEMEGVKAIVISSGGFKGAGVPGTEITQEQVDEWQKGIDALNDQFVAAVSKGRKLSTEKLQKLADGRVHISAEAKKNGLIDYVESLDQLFSRVAASVKATSGAGDVGAGAGNSQLATDNSQETIQSATGAAADDADARASDPAAGTVAAEERDNIMSKTTEAAAGSPAATGNTPPQSGGLSPATMKELKAACPGAPDSFLVSQIEADATVAQAKDAFIQFQSTQIRSRDEDLKKIQESGTTLVRPGTTGVSDGAGAGAGKGKGGGGTIAGGGDAITAYNEAVAEQMTKPGYSDRKKAVAQVNRTQKELHQAYLLANNPGTKQRDAINDRFAA